MHGDTVYLAGVVADKTAHEVVTEQSKEILSIIDSHLAKARSEKAKLVSATIYLADIMTFQEMNAACRQSTRRRARPSRQTLQERNKRSRSWWWRPGDPCERKRDAIQRAFPFVNRSATRAIGPSILGSKTQ
ncbi:hypothetical protein ABH999_000781 [Bradyrhizobium yuanmingense]